MGKKFYQKMRFKLHKNRFKSAIRALFKELRIILGFFNIKKADLSSYIFEKIVLLRAILEKRTSYHKFENF